MYSSVYFVCLTELLEKFNASFSHDKYSVIVGFLRNFISYAILEIFESLHIFLRTRKRVFVLFRVLNSYIIEFIKAK